MTHNHWTLSEGVLKIHHNAGFFSCCTIKLEAILAYFRVYQKLPLKIESHDLFSWYGSTQIDDKSTLFFHQDMMKKINWQGKEIYTIDNLFEEHFIGGQQQFRDYSKLQFEDLAPFIIKYFSPSVLTKKLIDEVNRVLPYHQSSICGVFYRGQDKSSETIQPSYAEVTLKALKLKIKYPNLKFWIESDEEDFKNYFIKEVGVNNCFYILRDSDMKVERSNIKEIDAAKYLATVMVFSKCKYIITTSGNGEFWIRCFRGNNIGSFQWLSQKEKIYGIKNSYFNPQQKYYWIDSENLDLTTTVQPSYIF